MSWQLPAPDQLEAVRKASRNALEKDTLRLGFIPLTDCALLAAAREKGFFEAYGLNVTLSREASWATIRDKVIVNELDAAQMLAPMPIAATAGISSITAPMMTAFSMTLNGNAITVSNSLYEQMVAVDPTIGSRRDRSASALARVLGQRRHRDKLRLAMVYPFSSHNYQLRYWLASGGIDPDRDIEIIVIPPQQMVRHLEQSLIDGFSVGEPWNSLAVGQGLGHTLITGYDIWNNSPEKVLGVTCEWAEQHPGTHLALIRALTETAAWVDDAGNREELADILAGEDYLQVDRELIATRLAGQFRLSASADQVYLPDFHVFFRYAANHPWRSHAVWFITQMLRWGQIQSPLSINELAARVYRPDIYEQAVRDLLPGCKLPDLKTEGNHDSVWQMDCGDCDVVMGADTFLDGRIFDPADPLAYMEGFEIHHSRIAQDLLEA